MKFKIDKASDWEFGDSIEIKTIKDLKELSKKYENEDLIINFKSQLISIYDDFIE